MVVPWTRRASLPWLTTLCAIIALFGAHAGRSWSFTVDDAAISFTFARNLADGHGLVLNPGGERVEGATNLLWTLLLSTARVFGVGYDLFAKLLGVSSAAAALVAVALLPASLREREPRYFDLVAPALVALMPHYSIWAVSGLENGLYAAIVCWMLHALAREERNPEQFPWSSVLLWLLFLTRPDGGLYALAVGLAKLARHLPPKRPRRQDVLWTLTLLSTVAAVELFRLAYFAWPVPNTFYSKTRWFSARQSLLDPRSDGWNYLGYWLYSYRLYLAAPLGALALFGRAPHGARLGLVGCATVALLFPVAVQGDWMGEFRFLTNAAPLLMLCVAEGARALYALVAKVTPRPARAALHLVATPLLAYALWRTAGRFYPDRWPIALQHNTITMETVAGRLRYFDAARARLAIDGRPSLLESDIGGTSFDGRYVVYDMLGLSDVSMAHAFPRDIPGFREAIFDERRPTFVRIHPTFAGTYELPRLEELSSLYLALPNTIDAVTDVDTHYVRREVVAAPYIVPARRLASSSAAAPDGVTLSHARVEPRGALWVDLFFSSAGATAAPSTVALVDAASGEVVQRHDVSALGALIAADQLLPGERPRARAKLVLPDRGRFRVIWSGHDASSVSLGLVEVGPGASVAESRALDAMMAESLRADRLDRAFELARSLTLRIAAAPADALARDALAKLARLIAERARVAADAHAYAIAASMALEARRLAPSDPRTLALASEVAERLADAARLAERAQRASRAFALARDAVLIDPRRSWARRRAEELRARRVSDYDGGRALAAYRAACAALDSGDHSERDRAIVFMASAEQWLEAARLSERAGHTPRDPRARVAVARGLLAQGRSREALALVSGVPCREARDPEVTLALRAIIGPSAFRAGDPACVEPADAARTTFDERVGSFESAQWEPWRTTGAAFGAAPSALTSCGAAWLNGWRGARFAHSLGACDDRLQGTLRSPVFTASAEGLSLLVGGGSDPQMTGVRLALEDGTTIVRSSGAGHDGMLRVFWDLRAVAGRRVFIEAFDRSPTGHVLLDDVREEWVLPAGVPTAAAASADPSP